MYVVVTRDLTFRSFCEDYTTYDIVDALTEALNRWEHFTREEKKDHAVIVYQLEADEDYDLIQEGEGTFDDYAREVKVYALGYIEEAEE